MKQNGTAQNVYTLKSNIFVDCGKSGQIVVGFNRGQTTATPVWDVSGNYFEWDGACVNADEITRADQRMNKMQKGINIVGGKKVVVK